MAIVAPFLTMTAAAFGQPEGQRVRFVWVRGPGAAGCSSQSVVARRVVARLGRDPFLDDGQVVIEGVVTREHGAWTARVEVRDLTGKRLGTRDLTSSAEDCKPIESAVTLAVALAIDPEAALRPEAEPAGPTSPSPVPTPAPAPRPAPPTPRLADQPVKVWAVLRGGVGGGFVPGVAPGFGIAVDVKPPGRFSVAAGALWFPEATTQDQNFAFGLASAFAGACVDAIAWSRGAIAACAAFHVGEIHAVTFKLEPTQPGGRLWLAPSVGVKLSHVLVGPLLLQAGVDGFAPLIRHDFIVEGLPGAGYQEPSVAGYGYMGAGVSFP
jgi:hypothetical protein